MELNFKTYGTGEPVIILHGLFGMLDNWHSLAKTISKEFEVFTLDLRNHGRSPWADEHNYAIMAKDLMNFMEEQNLFNVNIIGHSMGGKVGMLFTSVFPGFVRKLVVVDILPQKYEGENFDHKLIFQAIRLLEGCNFGNRKEVESKLDQFITNKRIFGFLLKNLTFDQNGCIRWKFNAKVLQQNYPGLADEIHLSQPVRQPVLFIKGENSPYIEPAKFEKAKSIFLNSELVTIEGASHWVHADAPGEFCNIVISFLKK